MLLLDLHFLDQFQDQTVLLVEKVIEQMLLFNLLVAEFICCLLQILNSLKRFLCEFTDIHTNPLHHLMK